MALHLSKSASWSTKYTVLRGMRKVNTAGNANTRVLHEVMEEIEFAPQHA